MAKSISRDKFIAQAGNLPRESVAVPELGGTVIIRGMSAKEKLAFEKTLMKAGGKTEEIDQDALAIRLLLQCMVDDDGKRLLEDSDAPMIEGLRGDVFQRLMAVAFRVNGYSVSAEGN